MTVFGHAALGATMYGVLRPHTTTTRWGLSRYALLLCCLLLPVLPDADAVMHFWVKYGHALGHRGVSHSILFALVFSIGLAWLLQRLGYAERTRQALGRMTLVFSLLMISHGITDTMTTGGKSPSLLWPIKSEGVWSPKRFIPVSPMGSSLLRTKWSKKQLTQMKKARTKLLRGKSKPFMLVRKVVSVSKRPDHYRRLGLIGIVLTEFLLLSPFALGVVGLAVWRRRRYGPAAKDPPRVRPPPQAPPEGPPARLWLAVSAAGVALAVAVGMIVHARAPDAGISITRGHLDDDVSTHYRRVAPADGSADSPVAVLFHGWRCSHQMMMPMARALARNGVEVWAVDLPGHGRSPTALETGCRDKKRSCQVPTNGLFKTASTSILDHLIEGELAGRDVVIIGHSTGAVAVHDLELQAETAESLAGRVVIEGRYKRLRQGGNRLIVGKPSYVKKFGNGLEPDVLHGSFADRSATELFTANLPHLDLVYDAGVNERILRWIADTTGATLGDATQPYRDRYIACAIALAALGLALGLLGAAYASRRGWLPPVCPSGHARPGIAFVCMVGGSLAAAMWAGELFRDGRPWLQGIIGQILPTYLMCASVCIGVPYVLLTRRPGRPDLRSLAVDTAFAVLVFASIYLTVGVTIDRFFFHVGLAPWRWVRFLAWTVAFLPVCLVVQEFSFTTHRWWARIASLFVHAMAWGAIVWVEAVGRNLVGDAMRLVGVLVLAEAWALCVGWRRQSRFFAALVSAMVFAWVMAAAYPILSGAPLG